MPTQVQFRRGTTTQNNNFTGASGELAVDTTLNTLRVHDGSTAGGWELLRKDVSNLVTAVTGVGASPTTLDTWSTTSYRSAKYIVSIQDVTNTQYETCEIKVIHDGTTPYINTFGLVYTGASARMTFTASISGTTLTLSGAGVSANNTVKFIRFLLPV